MTSVLPLKAQKEMMSLRRARFVLTGSLAALVGAFFACIALLPELADIYVLHPTTGSISTPLPETNDTERADILRAQALLAQFSGIASTTPMFEALTAALQARPRGAYLGLIRYTKETSTIVLQGNADRASVTLYRDALLRDPRFKTVSVPPEAFAGSEGGRFTITLTGTF